MDTKQIMAALETAGIKAREWRGGTTVRVYIDAASLDMTSSQRRQLDRTGGAYIERNASGEHLVQGLEGEREERVVSALRAVGVDAR